MKIGQSVKCPADRGDAPYAAVIVGIGEKVNTNINGVNYRWVEVQKACGSKHIWPSHRLGLKTN